MNKRVITFLVCLGIATLFWLIMSLSKNYTDHIDLAVEYINYPENQIITNELPQTIKLKVNTTGFTLLKKKFKYRNKKITIDIADRKKINHRRGYLTPNTKVEKITEQFNNSTKVLHVYPDTIFFDLSSKVSKVVPIKANVSLDFDSPFQRKGDINLTPRAITISGPKNTIALIDSINTKPITLSNINESTQVELELILNNKLEDVVYSETTIQLAFDVEQFTESQSSLPIIIKNLPKGLHLKIFPDMVNVKFNVGFSDFEKIKATDFKVIVDYNDIKKGTSKLKVQLKKHPLNIGSVRIIPEKVEFIIRKQ